MAKKNFYDALQVSRNADPETIRAAYKSLVQRYHPDKNPYNPEAEIFLKVINRAYEVLSDPVKRAGYDAALADGDEDRPEQSDASARGNNSGGANTGRRYSSPEGDVPRPWIRFWARFIDYFVCGVIVGFAIGIARGAGAISSHTNVGLTNPLIFSMLIIFIWALSEPIVMVVFGTTPGKALLRVRLTHQSNENLSKVGLGVLFQRSMAVWLKGMAMGFPLVWWITALISYRNLKSQSETSWDHDYGFAVRQGNVGYVRGSVATIIILCAIILNGVGNDYQKRVVAQQSMEDWSSIGSPVGAASPQSQQLVANPYDDPNLGKPGIPSQVQQQAALKPFTGALDASSTSPQSQPPVTQPNPFADPNYGKDLLAEQDDLVKRAEQGDAGAQYRLGYEYDVGQGVQKDSKLAVYWYGRAAEQGQSDAQYNLGVMYNVGDGVPQDYSQAVQWYRKAAGQGFAKAQFNLGNMYGNGDGVPQDYVLAVYWYRKAAEQGFAKAQFNLGNMYRNGKGVPRDYAQAVQWYLKAAEQGNARALQTVESIAGQAQITEGSKMAHDWLAKRQR